MCGRATAVATVAVGIAGLAVLGTGGDRPTVWLLPVIALVAAGPLGLGLTLALRRPDLMIGTLIASFAAAPLVVFAVESWGATADEARPWPGAPAAAVINQL